MTTKELKNSENFVEKGFIELKNSVEEIIKVFEKYQDMRKNSKGYIEEMKRFLGEINITLKEKKLTDKELINLDELTKTYFNFHDNSLSEYGVYDKDDLEKTNKANREITVVIERLKKFFIKLQKK
ncbi:hypothetical protein [Fusobacterium nucleatum]|uniref:Testis-expressed sequence 9 protein n=1 Tax=Fusobacterium nucleatum TaxID=851 RepID=A0A133NMX4_FUSNU|nr:hypothetical protein [Fusobacterium nucleatum]KXA17631.1 hypothetical protein HMPREF3221_01941 [Fusobacterium nucleatum]